MGLERLLAPLRGEEIPADGPQAERPVWELNHASIMQWMFSGGPNVERAEIFCQIHREWENLGLCAEGDRWMLKTAFCDPDIFNWVVDGEIFPAPHEFLMRWDDPTSGTYRYTWEVGK